MCILGGSIVTNFTFPNELLFSSNGKQKKSVGCGGNVAAGWKLKWEILACKCNISRCRHPRELGNFVTHLGNYTYPAKWVIYRNLGRRRYTLFIVAVFARISGTFNTANGFMGARHAEMENSSEEIEEIVVELVEKQEGSIPIWLEKANYKTWFTYRVAA